MQPLTPRPGSPTTPHRACAWRWTCWMGTPSGRRSPCCAGRSATCANTVVLRGHTDWVMSASFSPNGRFVLTACLDHSVRVFAAADRGAAAPASTSARRPDSCPAGRSSASTAPCSSFPASMGFCISGRGREPPRFLSFPLSADVKVSRAALTRDNRRSSPATETARSGCRRCPRRARQCVWPGRRTAIRSRASRSAASGQYAAAGTRTGDLRLWDLTRPRPDRGAAGARGFGQHG